MKLSGRPPPYASAAVPHLQLKRAVSRRKAVKGTLTGSVDDGKGNMGNTGHMGFNPHRKQKRRPSDIIFVVAALVVASALVAWAFLG